MKKLNLLVSVFAVVLIFELAGCKNASSSSSSDDTPAVTDNVVKYIPILGSGTIASASASVRSARNIVMVTTKTANDPQGIESQIERMAPILTGFKANSENKYKIGDTFTDTVFGQSVITTISESNGAVVYTCIFPDNISYYKLTVHSDMTFDFEQNIEFSYEQPANAYHGATTNYSIMSVSSVSAISINAAGEYDGLFVGKGISTTSDRLTRWNYSSLKYEIRSNTNAWVMKMIEESASTVHTADGEFTLANPKVMNILENGDTTPATSFAAGTLYGAYYCFNSYWNGFKYKYDSLDGDLFMTLSFTFADVKGVSQTMTYKDAAAYIWANMK